MARERLLTPMAADPVRSSGSCCLRMICSLRMQ
jgi:hypothetical protein